MPSIQVHNLIKHYDEEKAVDDLSLQVEDGKIFVILGPSGCGKTTTLRCIAGLERPDGGEIYIGDNLVTSVRKEIHYPPEKRNIGMVFQSYAIWPHLTVYENVLFPLKVRKVHKKFWNEKVTKALELVELGELGKRYVSELSGGQQQRVALSRALVYEPDILLLDEPLSNLDAKLREAMRFMLVELQRRLGITTVYVTHDQEEALVVADSVYVMNKGKIVQSGSPRQIYEKPVNKFVANFIGKSNFLAGKITIERLENNMPSKNEFSVVKTSDGIEVVCLKSLAEIDRGDSCVISIRPENINLFARKPATNYNVFEGRVEKKTFLGDRFDYRVLVAGRNLRVLSNPNVNFDLKENVYIQFNANNVLIIPEA